MAQKATIFNGLMRKTQVFRTKLRTELGEQIREFAPTDADLVLYCDRWLGEVERTRRIGECGNYVDDDRVDENDKDRKATETEIIESMIAFLDETDCEKEIYRQIGEEISSQGAHYFEELYGSEIPVYLNDIFVKCGGDRYYGTDGEFLLKFLKDEVEEIINKTMREHLSDKLPKKE